MADSGPLIFSIAVVAAFALIGGGVFLVARRRDRTKGVLMIVAAIVLLGNVLLWAAPIR